MNSKKQIIIIIVLVILLGGVLSIYLSQEKHESPQENVIIPAKIETKQIDPAQVPGNLPADLPIQSDDQILQNYEAVSGNGTTQGTRVMATSKNFDEAIKTYSDFFRQNKWSVVKEEKNLEFRYVLMKQEDKTVLVLVKKNPSPKNGQINTVEITLTETVDNQ